MALPLEQFLDELICGQFQQTAHLCSVTEGRNIPSRFMLTENVNLAY